MDHVGLAKLGPRLGAALIDRAPLAVIVSAWSWLALRVVPQHVVVLSVVAFVLICAWAVFQWWGYATRKAGVGYRALGLELVGASDGQPIGWWRMFLRTLVLYSTAALVLPGITLLVFLVIQERRQGWHDLAAGSLAVTRRKPVANSAQVRPGTASGRTSSIVPLPPHLLATAFATAEAPPPPAAPITAVPGMSAQPFTEANAEPAAPPAPPVQPIQPLAPLTQPSATVAAPPEAVESPGAHAPANPTTTPQPWAGPPVRAEQPPVRVVPRSTEEIPLDEYEGTRLVENAMRPAAVRSSDGAWFLKLDDGREIDIDQVVLIGRNPSPRPDEEAIATLVNAGEPSATISRTHLVVGVDERGAYVADRGSTNGTALVLPNGEFEPCPAGAQTRVREGQIVSFGERNLQIGRRS